MPLRNSLQNLFAFVLMILKLGFLRPGLRIPAMILLGVFCGLGSLLAHISLTTSYLIDSPDTCMNCHVMTDAYVSHRYSSHGRDVTCNDCHLPHTSFIREYAFKAEDGLRHAAAFTLRTEPQVMRLSQRAVPVVQENCIRCHEGRVSETSAASHQKSGLRCWDCHRDVVHGSVRSLSASPSVSRPPLPPVTQLPPMPPLSQFFGKGREKIEIPDWDTLEDSAEDSD
jgi:cytochrome c nitrite reductase small subunit